MKKLMLLNLKIKRKNTDYEKFDANTKTNKNEEFFKTAKMEKDTEENTTKMFTEMDRILSEKISFLLIDDYVYRYYLVNPKLKGVRKGDYGNISLSEPYIEK